MWKMLDIMDITMDAELVMFECDECAGIPLAPPPLFDLPPPPRPPALAEYTVVPLDCDEEQLAQQQWDSDVCQAMPILDASLYSSQSLATSAMIAVFTLLLILIILISSLFVWKHKRKVQNLLPCKTTARGPLNGAVALGGTTHNSHAMYEDPDAHLGHHRPLVVRHHHHHHHMQQQHPLHSHHHHSHHNHNHHHHSHYQQHPAQTELLHGKSIHYPSGYPMTRSPPFLVSSSPGPDPYRSHDNVYEELGPGRVDSDGESEPPLHSDDDFAEDELSLPGECSFNKAASNNIQESSHLPPSQQTPYHERNGTQTATTSTLAAVAASTTTTTTTATDAATPPATAIATPTTQERHSVLSSSSSSAQDASTATAVSSSAYSTEAPAGSSTAVPIALTPISHQQQQQRHTTGRNRRQLRGGGGGAGGGAAAPQDDLNTSSSTADIAEIAPLYDNRSNMMSLGYHARSTAPQYYSTLENEVERRNRINAQLSSAPVPPVSTIFRERIHYPGSGRFPTQQHPYYATNSAGGLLSATMRARTNPRPADRRLAHQLPGAHQHQHHRIHAAPSNGLEVAYGYAEPVYNANYFYDSAGARPYASTAVPTSYAMPDYRSPTAIQQQQQQQHHLYGRGDSSFGSDSGYSHHTPASSIGRHDYDLTEPPTATAIATATATATSASASATVQPAKSISKLSAALTFGWHRNNRNPSKPFATSMGAATNSSSLRISNRNNSSNEATSPNNNNNNNNACNTTTVTSQLEPVVNNNEGASMA